MFRHHTKLGGRHIPTADGRELLLARYHPGVVKTYEGPIERYQPHALFNLPQSAKIG
jgi:hypothetical protein